MYRDRAPLALLLCTGLLLSLAGPRPATLQRVPATPAGGPPAHHAGLPEPASGTGSAGLAFGGWPLRRALRGGPAGAFRWPLDGAPRVVRRFDPPAQPWLPGHRGVDLTGTPGATVRAAGAGRVRFAGRIAGRPVISVDHAGGLRTTYEPVEPVVRIGDEVSPGEPIGRLAVGHPGCAASACLHWGLRRGDVYLDPLALLGLGQVRLLPLPQPP
jgi:murein DD-endopeptidase MepM/ murein hydrolase activator NlpD